MDGSVDVVADTLRDALAEREEEEDEPNLQDMYIQYDGDIVQLCEAWKAKFKLRIDQGD